MKEKYIKKLGEEYNDVDYISKAKEALSKFYPKPELLKTKKSYGCISCGGCIGCGSCCGDASIKKYNIIPTSHSCVGCSGCSSCVGS